jgi:hypothetical protein
LLDGFEIICWDESNCSFDENEFVRKAADEKRWGFIGDYYRFKAVYEMGGIYLDTDIEVFHEFEPLLSKKCFFGFAYDSLICTAIFGAVAGHPLIKNLLNL